MAWHEETYGREARDRYGDREVDQAQAAVQALTQDQYLQWKQLGEEIQGKLEEAVRSGRSPQGAEGEAITALHRRWLTFTGQTYAGEKHRGLAALYTQDPRFTAYYDRAVPGCAALGHAAGGPGGGAGGAWRPGVVIGYKKSFV